MTGKMREEFEAWAAGRLRLKTDGETYYHSEAHYAWRAWQASLATLVVELPEPAVQGSDLYRGHAVRAAIESAGVRVKP